jgi:hypothetical protein
MKKTQIKNKRKCNKTLREKKQKGAMIFFDKETIKKEPKIEDLEPVGNPFIIMSKFYIIRGKNETKCYQAYVIIILQMPCALHNFCDPIFRGALKDHSYNN